MANICDEARRAMLMPYLAVRLIMPLSCDKSNDGGKGARNTEEGRPVYYSYTSDNAPHCEGGRKCARRGTGESL